MKITFCLKEPKSKESTLIYMICRWDGKQYKISSKQFILPLYWDKDKCKIKQTSKVKNVHTINNTLYDLENSARESFEFFINEFGRKPTGEEFKMLVKKHYFDQKPLHTKSESKTVSNYFDLYIQTIKNDVTESTIQKYKQAKYNFQEFERLNKSIYNVDMIDNMVRNSFVDYLVNIKLYKPTTIYRKMKFLKTVLLFTKSLGVGIHPFIENRNFLTKDVEVDNLALGETEIKELEEIDLNDNKKLCQIRDLFLLLCYTGQRFSDLQKINYSNIIDNQYLSIRQQKTKEAITIPITIKVKQILDSYNGKLPKISNVKFNVYLKELAQKIDSLNMEVGKNVDGSILHKYDIIKSHTARRTFVTLNFSRGVELDVLKIGTGHKQTKTLQSYVKMSDKQKADLLRSKLEK
ncbi:site-specific integrase [Empedobacter falsenii]